PDGSVQGSVTTHNGLMDDDVHALWPDEMGQVWIGLATGVVRLSGAGAGSWYDHRVGLGSGAVLKVFSHAGRVNVLTSRSVYALVPSTSSEPAHFTRTEKLWPLLRDGVSLDGQLWAGGSGGLWKVNDLTSSQEHKTNGDVYFLATPPSLPHGLLFFENTNIHAWLSSDFTVRDLDLHQTIDDVPSSVAVDKRGHIWVSTLSNRIYEFTWDDLLRRVQLNTEFEQGHGLPRSAGHLKLSTFDNDIVAFTESDILRFDKAANRFATMPLFDPFVGIAVSTPKANHGYWIVRSKILGSDAPYALLKMERTGKELIDFKFTPLDAPGLGQIAEVTSLDITGDGDDELLWIGGSNGLLRLETGSLRSVGTVSPLSLDARRTEESSSSSSHGQNLAHVSEVRRFVFEFQSRSAATGEPIFYQTKLEGAELGWSPPQSTSKREVAGLAPGSYVFDARPIDRFGRIGPSVRYPFTIESPWYLKPMAQSLWAILAALLVWIAVRFRIQRLQRQTEKLNRLVNERTRELTLSSAAKSEFLENISHEIRNPLNGIVGLVDLLDERGLSGKQRQHALSLKECSENLSRIFNDVLEFSKLEYGYAHLEERAFTIDSLLSSVRGVFLATAERQGNTIAIDVPTGFVDGFWGDDGKIRTIVSNFVSNALKYAPATPIVISVSCADAEGNTSKTNEANKVDLIIQVSDLGPGVPLEEQELIFRKFVRGTDAKNSNVPGSGIGLATSHMIAKLLDGNIGIESETGRGSLFFHKCRVARHTFTAAPSSEFQHPALTEGLSVLIVEDQHYNQVVLTGMVSKLGFQVTCAKDANETFAAISKRNFDIVFLDLELPGLKGPDVAQRLRQLACGPSLVLIGASANDTKEAAERSIAAGMDAFLVKPLSLEAIRSTLVSVLARRRTQTLGSVDLDFGSLELYATNVAGSMAKSVRIYLDILGKELDALRDAVLREHAKDILLTAHRLSSHASLVKAAELRRFLLELERGARLGQIANSRELLQEITESVAVVELKLTAKISSSVPESV
ncbi:MAG TPA: response regulator, partial [Opitutaceae bacterium]|nr:response regulator [Opitutaceae bacterium]